MHRLITIRFSHFNEKARWALERFGVPYREEGYMPLIHMLGVIKLAPKHGIGAPTRHTTPFSTPVLVTDDGRCFRDSASILHYVSDRFAPEGEGLYPTEEVAALEERFANGLGVDTRRFAYFHLFKDDTSLAELADANVGNAQARWFKRLYPVAKRFIRRGLVITPERAARSLERMRAEMTAVSEMVGGKKYLVGDRFTAADLAFACMAAPLVLPSPEEGYGATLPPVERCPRELQAIVREARATEAGQFALRMFREERRFHPPRPRVAGGADDDQLKPGRPPH